MRKYNINHDFKLHNLILISFLTLLVRLNVQICSYKLFKADLWHRIIDNCTYFYF